MFLSSKLNKQEFVTVEEKVRRSVIGLWESEAIKHVEKNGLIPFVDFRDRSEYKPHCGTAHSYRIRMTVKKGKVVDASIG